MVETMLHERHNSEPPPEHGRLIPEKLKASPLQCPRQVMLQPVPASNLGRKQKRRDQNRISQRAYRLRKERRAIELEARVEGLEILPRDDRSRE